jgi:hypothetical protein
MPPMRSFNMDAPGSLIIKKFANVFFFQVHEEAKAS